eukprot:2154324-Amphidinium_carterae.1
MRIDGNGDLEGIQAFWCACHKTTIPRNCDYALCCGGPEEGECVVCVEESNVNMKDFARDTIDARTLYA